MENTYIRKEKFTSYYEDMPHENEQASSSLKAMTTFGLAVFIVFIGGYLTIAFWPKVGVLLGYSPIFNGLIAAFIIAAALYFFTQVLRLKSTENFFSNYYTSEDENDDYAQPKNAFLIGPEITSFLTSPQKFSASYPKFLHKTICKKLQDTVKPLNFIGGIALLCGLLGTFWSIIQILVTFTAALSGAEAAQSDLNLFSLVAFATGSAFLGIFAKVLILFFEWLLEGLCEKIAIDAEHKIALAQDHATFSRRVAPPAGLPQNKMAITKISDDALIYRTLTSLIEKVDTLQNNIFTAANNNLNFETVAKIVDEALDPQLKKINKIMTDFKAHDTEKLDDIATKLSIMQDKVETSQNFDTTFAQLDEKLKLRDDSLLKQVSDRFETLNTTLSDYIQSLKENLSDLKASEDNKEDHSQRRNDTKKLKELINDTSDRQDKRLNQISEALFKLQRSEEESETSQKEEPYKEHFNNIASKTENLQNAVDKIVVSLNKLSDQQNLQNSDLDKIKVSVIDEIKKIKIERAKPVMFMPVEAGADVPLTNFTNSQSKEDV
ncbi:MAG: hypothetical protein AAF621_04550 [Pseudomonadota bacterium]